MPDAVRQRRDGRARGLHGENGTLGTADFHTTPLTDVRAVLQGWGLSYCGAIVDRAGPDFLSTSINERSLEYPRILVPGSMVNGDQEPEISCADGLTCRNLCETFSRTARIGNLPEPEACALCKRKPCREFDAALSSSAHGANSRVSFSAICPSNMGTTVVAALEAFGHDGKRERGTTLPVCTCTPTPCVYVCS